MKHIIKLVSGASVRTASVEAYRKDGELRLWTKVHSPEFVFKKEPTYLLTLRADRFPSAKCVSETLLRSPKWNTFFEQETSIPTNIQIDDAPPTKVESIGIQIDDDQPVSETPLVEGSQAEAIRSECNAQSWLQLRATAKGLNIQSSHLKRHELTELIVQSIVRRDAPIDQPIVRSTDRPVEAVETPTDQPTNDLASALQTLAANQAQANATLEKLAMLLTTRETMNKV